MNLIVLLAMLVECVLEKCFIHREDYPGHNDLWPHAPKGKVYLLDG